MSSQIEFPPCYFHFVFPGSPFLQCEVSFFGGFISLCSGLVLSPLGDKCIKIGGATISYLLTTDFRMVYGYNPAVNWVIYHLKGNGLLRIFCCFLQMPLSEMHSNWDWESNAATSTFKAIQACSSRVLFDKMRRKWVAMGWNWDWLRSYRPAMTGPRFNCLIRNNSCSCRCNYRMGNE